MEKEEVDEKALEAKRRKEEASIRKMLLERKKVRDDPWAYHVRIHPGIEAQGQIACAKFRDAKDAVCGIDIGQHTFSAMQFFNGFMVRGKWVPLRKYGEWFRATKTVKQKDVVPDHVINSRLIDQYYDKKVFRSGHIASERQPMIETRNVSGQTTIMVCARNMGQTFYLIERERLVQEYPGHITPRGQRKATGEVLSRIKLDVVAYVKLISTPREWSIIEREKTLYFDYMEEGGPACEKWKKSIEVDLCDAFLTGIYAGKMIHRNFDWVRVRFQEGMTPSKWEAALRNVPECDLKKYNREPIMNLARGPINVDELRSRAGLPPLSGASFDLGDEHTVIPETKRKRRAAPAPRKRKKVEVVCDTATAEPERVGEDSFEI